jgi:hypothetical protein
MSTNTRILPQKRRPSVAGDSNGGSFRSSAGHPWSGIQTADLSAEAPAIRGRGSKGGFFRNSPAILGWVSQMNSFISINSPEASRHGKG